MTNADKPSPVAELASEPLIRIDPQARVGKPPCPECHLQAGETCDICGAKEPPAPAVDERTPDSDSGHLAAASNGSPGGAPDVDSLRGLDTPTRVRFYEHDFYVLSNFSAFTLYWRGLRFDTSEAAYHFEKFPTYPRIRERIKNAPSAHEAFKIAEAEKHMRRPDWDDVKVSIMRNLLREKAKQHEYVRRKLLATGDRELVEDSWRDDFWGWGPNRDGQNMLGKLWMEVRAELRSAAVSPDAPAK